MTEKGRAGFIVFETASRGLLCLYNINMFQKIKVSRFELLHSLGWSSLNKQTNENSTSCENTWTSHKLWIIGVSLLEIGLDHRFLKPCPNIV